MRPRQISFLPRIPLEHGGSLRQGKRKTARVIDPKRAIHVVMRSTRARGAWSLLHPKNEGHVRRLAEKVAHKRGVRLYRFANVGNHLHLLVKTPDREAFRAFLREFAGAVAMAVTGARKGSPSGRFWDLLAYTRLVAWGRDYRNLELYFVKNLFEAAGLLSKKAKAAGLRLIPLLGWADPPRAA